MRPEPRACGVLPEYEIGEDVAHLVTGGRSDAAGRVPGGDTTAKTEEAAAAQDEMAPAPADE